MLKTDSAIKLILPAIILFALTASVSAATYYVDAVNGNDSWTGTAGVRTGTTSTGPWKTLDKVNSDVSGSGDDVYLLQGQSYPIPTSGLVFDWAGTSGNRVVIGSYYLDKSSSPVAGFTAARAIISGVGKTRPIGPIPPSNVYGVMVRQPYVTIQDVEITESNGSAVGVVAAGKDVVVNNCKIHHPYNSGIMMMHVDGATITNNEVYETNYEDHLDGLWGHAIGGPGNSNIVIRFNKVYRSWGEGIGPYGGLRNAIIDQNIVYDVRRPNIYLNCARDVVVSRNLVYSTSNRPISGTPHAVGIHINFETDGSCPEGIVDNISVWGNLVANTKTNFSIWMPPGYYATNMRVYNNTFIEPLSNSDFPHIRIMGTTAAQLKNNIVWQSAGNACPIALVSTGQATGDYNAWSKASGSVDSDIRGLNDIYSFVGVTKTTGWASLSPNSLTGVEFALPAGSLAIDAGVNLCPNGCASGFEYNTLLNAAQSNLTVPTWINTTQSGAWDAGAAPFAAAIIPDTPPAAPTGLSIR